MIEELLLTKDGGVATLTLNRPDKMNAMTTAMWYGIRDIVEEVANDDEITVLIITGAGRGFCAGSDVEDRLAARIEGIKLETTRKAMLEPVGFGAVHINSLGKPIIAAINGVTVGAGLSIALLCDIRIASDKARFGAVWIRVGLIPDLGATYSLPRTIGPDRALELSCTGDIIDAREAERIGLVTRVVPHDDLMKVATDLARRIARGPSVAIELTKRAIYRGLQNDLDKQLDFESYAQNICRGTADHREGVSSFKEKREAIFKGM